MRSHLVQNDLKEMVAKYKKKKFKNHGKAKKKTTYSKHEMNALVKKSVKKALDKNKKHRSKKKAKEELQAIESHDMDISDDEKSTKSSSSSLSSHSSDDF